MKLPVFIIVSTFLFINVSAQQRLLNKLKEKAEDKMVEELFDDKKSNPSGNNSSGSSQSSGNDASGSSSNQKVQNTKGGGLEQSSVDVNASIQDALLALNDKKYADARYNIRQAIMGIEIEMGTNVLNSLPKTINNLPTDETRDKVTSSGIGFAGLLIERYYTSNDQEVSVNIANNSIWVASVNAYFSGTYKTTDPNQNFKDIKVQGLRGVIEYNESSGYKVSVPFGQSSIFIMTAVNFENEKQVLNAVNQFNIENINKKLGETTAAKAQQGQQKLKDAETSYKNKDLESARFALEQALNEVDILLGKEILTMLPTALGGAPIVAKDDQVTGSGAGFMGLFVQRNYALADASKTINISIIGDSPLLAGINAMLALPAFVTSGDPNQKRIKVDGYKSLMQKSESEGKISYEIQIPFGNNLITCKLSGYNSETEVTGIANNIPVAKIAGLVR